MRTRNCIVLGLVLWTAGLAAEDAQKLASIVDMTRFVEADGLASAAPPAPEAAADVPADTAPPAETVVDAGEQDELPEFEIKKVNVDARLLRTVERTASRVAGSSMARVRRYADDLHTKNEELGVARLYYRYGLFEHAHGAYREVLRKEGATLKERASFASGVIGLEALRVAIFLGRLEDVKRVMPVMQAKAKEANVAIVVQLGDETLDFFQKAAPVLALLERLDKASAGSGENAPREDAARQIICAYLASGTDRWRYALGQNPATGQPLQDAYNNSGGSRSVSGWAAAYPQLNVIVSRNDILGYRDVQTYAMELSAVPAVLHHPYRFMASLFGLIIRCPGHQVVQSGEAFLRLVDALADIEAITEAVTVCHAGASIAAEADAVKDGELSYLAAEILFRDRQYGEALKYYQALMSANSEHRAVMDGTVLARIRQCADRRQTIP
ncbi:MAG TPA: hypothetical protein ENN09_06300 [Planctomycetes bacterium]|nr:hypothetical protein [Planctomycetota bacterium]